LFGIERAFKAVVEYIAIKPFPVVAATTPYGVIKIPAPYIGKVHQQQLRM
jgi:hypothetical protein